LKDVLLICKEILSFANQKQYDEKERTSWIEMRMVQTITKQKLDKDIKLGREQIVKVAL
jgi:hypothetical protein